MPELITDQKKLLELALELSVDLNALIENIQLDPATLHEESRSQLVGGFIYFLQEAIGLTAVEKNVSSQEPGSITQLVRQIRAYPPVPTFRPSTKPRGDCILISGVPREVTSSQLLQQIHGGPLESVLRRRIPKDGRGGNFICFSINFLAREVAEAAMAYLNSPAGRLRFPGANNITVSWCVRGDSHMLYVLKAAWDTLNPARRVLIFDKCPRGIMNKTQMALSFQCLDKRFSSGEYCVDSYEVALDRMKGRLIFNCIGAAVCVMKLHKEKRLGAAFKDCGIVYGRDPVDHPIPAYNASRVVILYGYFGDVGAKMRLSHKLQLLERKFVTAYCVDEFQIHPFERKARIIFNCVQAAIKFREYHVNKIFGAEFDNCGLVFGGEDCLIESGSTAQVHTPPSTPSTESRHHDFLEVYPTCGKELQQDEVLQSGNQAFAPPNICNSGIDDTLALGSTQFSLAAPFAPVLATPGTFSETDVPTSSAIVEQSHMIDYDLLVFVPESPPVISPKPILRTFRAPEMAGFEELLLNKHE